MLYRPAIDRLWDTWIVPHLDQFYMFYIRISPSGARWDGVSLAISSDLLHWEEYGPVLEKSEEASWLGTGMIHKLGNRFIMNYSEEKPKGYQNILFAQSHDLIHWEKITDIHLLPDPQYYLNRPEDTFDGVYRWDSLGIIEPFTSVPPYYSVVCAYSDHKGQPGGSLGLLKSNDGVNWECLPTLTDVNLFPVFEVPEYLSIANRHYVLFSSVTAMGTRFDSHSRGLAGGTYYVVSDYMQGPYVLPPSDGMILGIRNHPNLCMAYVGRTIKIGEDIIFYHIWGSKELDGWAALPKRLMEVSPYELALHYWNKCNALKGDVQFNQKDISKGCLKPIRFSEMLKTSIWELDNQESLRFTICSSVDGIQLDLAEAGRESSYDTGNIYELNLRVECGTGAGLFFDLEDGTRLGCFFNYKKSEVEFGTLYEGWSMSIAFQAEQEKSYSLNYEMIYTLRIFERHCFLEIYCNDLHIFCYRTNARIQCDRIGLFAEDAIGCIEELQVWQMNLNNK